LARQIKIRLSKEEILQIERRISREMAKESGFFDGRNIPKIIPSKKKEQNKNHCRRKGNHGDQE